MGSPIRCHSMMPPAALAPEQALCALYGLGRFGLAGEQPANAEAVCPGAEMGLLYPWMLRQARAEGRQVFVWFGALEAPWTVRLLMEFGADGLIVDDVGQAVETRRNR